MEELTTKVTKINNRWHCRLYNVESVFDEMACSDQRDIGYCMKEMLRWYDKLGFEPFSKMAIASRHRIKNNQNIHGKIYYKNDIQAGK